MTRLTKLQNLLEAKEIDAILITNPINRKYITGFTGTSGVVLISKDDQRLITDFRYIEQATEQAKGFTIVEHTKSIELAVNEELKQLKVKKLGFEQNTVTYAGYERYKKVLAVDLIPVSGVVEELRLLKSPDEIAVLQLAANIADEAFEHIQSYIKPGVKEIDIATELEFFMRKQGATSSSFDIIVASGLRSALPHGVASEKVIQNGELVTMDYGALYNDYCSDITRTVAVGEISKELRTIYDTVLEAQILGVKGVKPGITGKAADELTRDYITAKGFGTYFGHSTGHGLGLEVHEEPRLSPNSDELLKEGMIVTVEPGIYIPGVGGCRIEDDLVITKSGNKRLTNASKELVQL